MKPLHVIVILLFVGITNLFADSGVPFAISSPSLF